MLFLFSGHTLDVATRELRRGSEVVQVQPQVLDILIYLIRNRERMVTKDDLIAAVWQGRVISESTLTTRINAARKAVGDSGEHQRIIRTVSRKGFRFVAEVRESAEAPSGAAEGALTANDAPPARLDVSATADQRSADDALLRAHRRASIAVLPFVDLSPVATTTGGTADALVYDVITRLAKLRALFVIAQGTVFALRDRQIEPLQAGRMLNVDYIVTGSVRRSSRRLTVATELTEARSSRIVWAEAFDRPLDDAFLILDQIGDNIVSSIATEIETFERNRAILKPPHTLDAWEAHHRGLWHMYRFNKADNEQAQHFFETAIGLDPTFSRAYAGLSFAHWQNAFQGWKERQSEAERAYAAAGQSLMADDRDPAAHWAMGRALWLRGLLGDSIAELEQSVDLSPNFAQAHYSLGFVHATTGDAEQALVSSDYSHRLSPFDPMLFANLAVRAMAFARLGQFDEAANWATSGAARPNAHVQIVAIAAYTLALAGRLDEARAYLAQVHRSEPDYRIEDFLRAFHLDPEAQRLYREAAKLVTAG